MTKEPETHAIYLDQNTKGEPRISVTQGRKGRRGGGKRIRSLTGLKRDIAYAHLSTVLWNHYGKRLQTVGSDLPPGEYHPINEVAATQMLLLMDAVRDEPNTEKAQKLAAAIAEMHNCEASWWWACHQNRHRPRKSDSSPGTNVRMTRHHRPGKFIIVITMVFFGMIFLIGIFFLVFGAMARDQEVLLQGGSSAVGGGLMLCTFGWIIWGPGSDLTKIQSITVGIFAVLVSWASTEAAIVVAQISLPLTAALCAISIPLAKVIATRLHERFLRGKILQNLEAESGQGKDEDDCLIDLANNSSLPTAAIYAATVGIAISTYLTSVDLERTTIIPVSTTVPTILALVIYNLSSEQAKIRNHMKNIRDRAETRPKE